MQTLVQMVIGDMYLYKIIFPIEFHVDLIYM